MSKDNKSLVSKFIGMKTVGKTIVVVLIVSVFIMIGIAVGSKISFNTESDTATLGFKDIGELVTQEAYTTEVSHTEDARKIFGATIPLTKSKYIYSYQVIIKAGYDFTKIEHTIDDEKKLIELQLPKPKIISNQIVEDSLEVYLEDESLFKQISLKDNSKARIKMSKNAEKNAIANGLFENAEKNAKTILKAFIIQNEKYKNYQLKVVE